MLQCIDDKIIEVQNHTLTVTGGGDLNTVRFFNTGSAGSWYNGWPTIYWSSYPVYVCTDKTAKSIEILKKLQAEEQLEVKSVLRFIELVEMIAQIL